MVGLSPTLANALLDEMYALGYRWLKMHTGDPGAAGTANPAAEAARKQITAGAAAGGVLTSSADLDWTTVAATEGWTHASLWTAVTGGTFGLSGQIAPKSVSVGDDVNVPAGSVTATLPLAA